MTASTDLVYVRTVYGDRFRISRAQLDGQRVQLTLYTDTGKRLSDYYAAMNWPPTHNRGTTLHRGNIASVESD